MLKRGQEQGLAFEIADGFFMLRAIEVRFDHLFDGAWGIAQMMIFRQINRAHPAAADSSDNLITPVQERARFELLDGWLCALPSNRRALSPMPELYFHSLPTSPVVLSSETSPCGADSGAAGAKVVSS